MNQLVLDLIRGNALESPSASFLVEFNVLIGFQNDMATEIYAREIFSNPPIPMGCRGYVMNRSLSASLGNFGTY